MTKPELQRIALKLFNQGIVNAGQLHFSKMRYSTDDDFDNCMEYIDEIIRIGKTEFNKKYCIKT